MSNIKQLSILTGLLMTGLVFGDAKSKPSAGPMKVEEPSDSGIRNRDVKNVKISKEQRALARGLTAEQKQAFRDRKEKMQEMIALITEKRQALQAAKPDERAALARELHSLILEKEPAGMDITGQARVKSDKPAAKPPSKWSHSR